MTQSSTPPAERERGPEVRAPAPAAEHLGADDHLGEQHEPEQEQSRRRRASARSQLSGPSSSRSRSSASPGAIRTMKTSPTSRDEQRRLHQVVVARPSPPGCRNAIRYGCAIAQTRPPNIVTRPEEQDRDDAALAPRAPERATLEALSNTGRDVRAHPLPPRKSCAAASLCATRYAISDADKVHPSIRRPSTTSRRPVIIPVCGRRLLAVVARRSARRPSIVVVAAAETSANGLPVVHERLPEVAEAEQEADHGRIAGAQRDEERLREQAQGRQALPERHRDREDDRAAGDARTRARARSPSCGR